MDAGLYRHIDRDKTIKDMQIIAYLLDNLNIIAIISLMDVYLCKR